MTHVLVSDDGNTVTYMLYGNMLLGQQVAGSSQFQTHITDGLGSVRVEMETNGSLYTRTFSPFGETLAEAGTSSSVYGYTGQQEDDSIGLIYLRARYYSADLKAFTAYDVWSGVNTRPQSLNHYAYTEGNPILKYDPSGNIAICFEGGGSNNKPYQSENWSRVLASKVGHVCGYGLFHGNYLPQKHGDVYYYLKNDEEAITSAYNRIYKAFEENQEQPIIIIGYSWGGAAAVDLSQRLNDGQQVQSNSPIQIDLLFLIDPVLINRSSDKQNDHSDVAPWTPANVNKLFNILAGNRAVGGSVGEYVYGYHGDQCEAADVLETVFDPSSNQNIDVFHSMMGGQLYDDGDIRPAVLDISQRLASATSRTLRNY